MVGVERSTAVVEVTGWGCVAIPLMLLVLLPMAPLIMPLIPPNMLVLLPPLVAPLPLLLLYREVRGILNRLPTLDR